MKRDFQIPELNMVQYEVEDVIVTSVTNPTTVTDPIETPDDNW